MEERAGGKHEWGSWLQACGWGGRELAGPTPGAGGHSPGRAAHTAPMAPHPSSRLRLLLLLCCLGAAQAQLLSLLWPWSTGTKGPSAPPVSVPRGSPSVQSTEDTTTHVAHQDGPTEQGTAPTSRELPPERLEAGLGRASAAPTASTESPENIAGVGAEILNVAMGIRNFVRLWDNTTPAESSTRAGTATPATPTDLLTLPGPSSASQENGTVLWPSSGAPSSPVTQRTEAGTSPVPTQPPPSPGTPQALLREPSLPPPSPGRALSSTLGGAPLWGSRPSPGQLQDLDGEELLPVAARPGQQHRHADVGRHSLHLLPLVTGSLGTALSALSSDSPTELSQIALSALIGDSGAWIPHVANSVGPGLANNSSLLGADPLTPAGQPVHNAAGRCLPLPPSLPVCGRLGIGRSWLPNHLHHVRSEEVQAAARAWGGLLRTHCHRFLAWFFCLLLAPPCGPPPAPPPCRQFCEVLEDACWSHLDGGGLPVSCASLPAQEDGYCVFIGPAAGNWLASFPRHSLVPCQASSAGLGDPGTEAKPAPPPVLGL